MFNNNQVELLMNILSSIESNIRVGRDHGATNANAYVNKYKNNRSLNQVLKEIEYVQCDYVDKMKDIKDRIMNEINL